VRVEEFAVRLMGPTWRGHYRTVQGGGAGTPAITLRSSIWRRDDAAGAGLPSRDSSALTRALPGRGRGVSFCAALRHAE